MIPLDIIPKPDELFSEAGQRLPAAIRLGTSTWAFPEWKGLVYRLHYRTQKEFRQTSLAEYATVPWFRTVCIDSFFYQPASRTLLEEYARQVPPDFQWVSKVWERITIPRYPKHARYGAWAGKENPDFLNADLFLEKVLQPFEAPELRPHVGPFVFQFPQFGSDMPPYGTFLERLGTFLSKLPREYRYAVEVRNDDLLNNAYFKMLNNTGATHCFNQWNRMISIKAQMKRAAAAGGLVSDFYVARLLTPPGVAYETADKLFVPYNSIKQPNVNMRSDVIRLAKRAIERNVPVFVTANNKSEGNSPLTITAIGQLVLDTLEGGEHRVLM